MELNELGDVVELKDDTEVIDIVGLLDVVGSTEVSKGIVFVVIRELDVRVDDEDVVF